MFCPKCGKPGLEDRNGHEFRCPCGFHYFQNVAAAVAAILQCGEEILVVTRARNPGQGLLDFPGGFVDPGEPLEAALRRELVEELGFDCSGIECAWLGSAANLYRYEGITYNTCDSYFHLLLGEKPALSSRDDVADFTWIRFADIDSERFAFSSSREGLSLLRLRGTKNV